MGNTLREIITEVYNLLGEEDSSTIFDRNTIVIPKINREILNVCKGQVKNLLTQSMIRSSLLRFLYKEDIYKIPTKKKLMSKINIGDTEIDLSDTEGLPSTGFLFIFGMFLKYSIIDDIVTLDKEIEKEIDLGEEVRFAIEKPSQSIQYQDIREYETNNKLEYYNFQDKPIHSDIAYTIKPYEKNDYIIFDNYSGKVIVPYIDRPEELEDLDDECILPDDYGVDVIAGLVAGPLLINDQQQTKGQNALLGAYGKLVEMYNFYATPIKERRKSVKVRQMDLSSMY